MLASEPWRFAISGGYLVSLLYFLQFDSLASLSTNLQICSNFDKLLSLILLLRQHDHDEFHLIDTLISVM